MDAKHDIASKVINGRINGRFAPGCSGNPGGSPEATRRAFNKRFLLDLAEDWQQHGREVFKRVRRESPAAYMKICALLVPREMKIAHSGGVKSMSDDELERAIEVIQAMLAAREASEQAKVIEAAPEPGALPPPANKTKRKRRKSDVGLAVGSEEEGVPRSTAARPAPLKGRPLA